VIQDLTCSKKELVKYFLDREMLIDSDILSRIKVAESCDELDEIKKELLIGAGASVKGPETGGSVEIISCYDKEPHKREVQHFVGYFNARYNALKAMLMRRQEMQGLTSISRVISRKEKDNVSIIGLVLEKNETPNGHIMLTLEDPTGKVKVLINKNRNDLLALGRDIVLDETIGIVGVNGDNIVFANSLLFPDIPMTKELRKSPEEEYAVFIGDFHFGNNEFLKDDFLKFVSWLKGDTGTESQRDIASKVKYIFLVGDLVEGVGIYPGQEKDLEIDDIYQQYEALTEYIAMIPTHMKIIICPGNHDAMRIAEPQPVLYKDFAESIWKLPNVVLVSNPAMVNVGKKEGFPGFDVLLYHGFSFPFYADVVKGIREKGGQDRSDLIMKFLLQRRHLAPMHTSTLYLPDAEKDYLVIDKVPDFFITGHIHRAAIANYRNITMINCSTWIPTSDYQIKLGIKAQPSKVPVVNLRTREARIMNFGEKET